MKQGGWLTSHPKRNLKSLDLNINLKQKERGMNNLKREDTCTSFNLKDGGESSCSIIKQIPLQIDEKIRVKKEKKINVIYYLNLLYIKYNI